MAGSRPARSPDPSQTALSSGRTRRSEQRTRRSKAPSPPCGAIREPSEEGCRFDPEPRLQHSAKTQPSRSVKYRPGIHRRRRRKAGAAAAKPAAPPAPDPSRTDPSWGKKPRSEPRMCRSEAPSPRCGAIGEPSGEGCQFGPEPSFISTTEFALVSQRSEISSRNSSTAAAAKSLAAAARSLAAAAATATRLRLIHREPTLHGVRGHDRSRECADQKRLHRVAARYGDLPKKVVDSILGQAEPPTFAS